MSVESICGTQACTFARLCSACGATPAGTDAQD